MILVLLALAALAFIGWRIEAHHRPTATDTPEPDYGGCNDIRPHAMIPTAYGWKCANDCGESWYVEDSDALAAADLALWEIENDWEVEA